MRATNAGGSDDGPMILPDYVGTGGGSFAANTDRNGMLDLEAGRRALLDELAEQERLTANRRRGFLKGRRATQESPGDDDAPPNLPSGGFLVGGSFDEKD